MKETGGCQYVTGLDLQTLGSQPVMMPKNLPDHWPCVVPTAMVAIELNTEWFHNPQNDVLFICSDQCPGSFWAYIVGQDQSESKSSQLDFDIFRFCFQSFIWGLFF
jgi:hypothetical protein